MVRILSPMDPDVALAVVAPVDVSYCVPLPPLPTNMIAALAGAEIDTLPLDNCGKACC